MSSFYEKLSMKLQGEDDGGAAKTAQPTSRMVTYSATGEQKASPKKEAAAVAVQPAVEAAPDGTDPIDIDLFQSDLRMVVFMQVSGIAAEGFEVTLSEESNTLMIEATQKRPPMPIPKGGKEGDQPEKGIFAKQEVKWRSLYRKIYLPAQFDAGSTTATLDRGVLVINLPAKHPGVGQKLEVIEVHKDEHKK